MQNNSFYMLLPSNSSPETQPKNSPADYIVDWENPIQLDPNSEWRVALTEINYIYSPATISTQYSIRYKIFKEIVKVHYFVVSVNFVPLGEKEETFDTVLSITPDNLSGVLKIELKDEYDAQGNDRKSLSFSSEYPFKIQCESIANVFQIPNNVSPYMKWSPYCISGKTDFNKLLEEAEDDVGKRYQSCQFKIEMYHYDEVTESLNFPDNVLFSHIDDLTTYLKQQCVTVFKDVKMNKKRQTLQITLMPRVYGVDFLGGLNFALGFSNFQFVVDDVDYMQYPSHDKAKDILKADFPAQLNRGVQSMFIYSSICQPIHVGHTMAPLLRRIFIDPAKDDNGLGSVRNFTAKYPMYLPVAASSFNQIEINIRNDAGQFITFPSTSITDITLHFERL